jgi:hypothetical protein
MAVEEATTCGIATTGPGIGGATGLGPGDSLLRSVPGIHENPPTLWRVSR